MKRYLPLESSGGTPEGRKGRKEKLAKLKEAITDGSYEIKADDLAAKILRDLLLQFVPLPAGGKDARSRKK